MSRLAVDDLFYGKPERVRYVAGGHGGYGGSLYQTGPHYYSDGDGGYYSHRHSGQVVYPTGRPMLPDVKLSVPMDSTRCVEKVKEALDINGVLNIHCDVPSQTVTVSGNVAPQAPQAMRRVKNVKKKSKIQSYTNLHNNAGHIAPHHRRTTSAYGIPAYGSSAYSSSYYRLGHILASPPREHSYYNRYNQHTFAHPMGYNDHHYTNYY